MNESRFLELLERQLEQPLSAEEAVELQDHLRTSELARDEYWSFIEQHVLIEELLREMRGRDLAVVEGQGSLDFQRDAAVQVVNPVPVNARLVSWSSSWIARFSLLALFCIVASVFWGKYVSPKSLLSRSEVATLRSLTGIVSLCDASGSEFRANSGGAIVENQSVVVGEDGGQAEIVLIDGSQLTLTSGSTLEFRSASEEVRGNSNTHRVPIAASRWLHLARGALQVDAAPQELARPLVITTEHSRVTVTGTRFRLYSDHAESRVELDEGKVQFEQQSDGQSVEVVEGHFAVATSVEDATTPLVSKLLQTDVRLQKTFLRAGRSPVISRDGRFVAAADYRQIRVWDIASGELIDSISHDKKSDQLQLAFSADGRQVVSLGSAGFGAIWQRGESMTRLASLRAEQLRRGTVSSDAQWIVQGSGAGEVAVWKVRPMDGEVSLAASIPIKPTSVAISSGVPMVAISEWNGTITKFDVNTGKEVARFRLASTPLPLAISEDGRWLAAYTQRDGLVLFDGEASQHQTLWPSDTARVEFVTFSANHAVLFAAMNDGVVRAWSTIDGRSLMVLETGDTHLTSLDVTSDRKKMVTAGDRGSLKIWELDW